MQCYLLIKAGVDISRLDRPTRRGLQIIGKVFDDYNESLIITSTYEGNHSPGSLHYANQAFDVRKPSEKRSEILAECRKHLGKNWDVVTESTHWHFEYDPK